MAEQICKNLQKLACEQDSFTISVCTKPGAEANGPIVQMLVGSQCLNAILILPRILNIPAGVLWFIEPVVNLWANQSWALCTSRITNNLMLLPCRPLSTAHKLKCSALRLSLTAARALNVSSPFIISVAMSLYNITAISCYVLLYGTSTCLIRQEIYPKFTLCLYKACPKIYKLAPKSSKVCPRFTMIFCSLYEACLSVM